MSDQDKNLADQVNEVFDNADLSDVADPADTAEANAANADAADAVDGEVLDAEVTDAADADATDGAEDALKAELAERTEDLQRVSAEFANYRRRVDRDRALDRELAKSKVINELLPLADDLDRAEQHGDLSDGPLKAFADKFRNTLTSLKVVSFGEEGEEFDPNLHEAVQDTSNGDDKALAAVLRKGYRLEDRVIRTAMVVIGDPS